MRSFWMAGLWLMGAAAHAQTYTVGGSVSGLIGSNLQLQLNYTNACLADGQQFTLQSTDTHDCFTPANLAKCCSQAIRFTAYDGISTVTCTCGFATPVRPDIADASGGSGAEIVNIPKGAVAYQFATPVADLSTYSAQINSQPTGPIERCTLVNASGTVNGHNVTNLNVICSDRIFANGFN